MGTLPHEPPPTELRDYVLDPDDSFAWEAAAALGGGVELHVRTQRWQGIVWEHSLLVVEPPATAWPADTAVIYITGGRPNPLDAADAVTVAANSGLTTAMLFDMPNQPLFDLTEDALIAHTFERYLEAGDRTWPILFPMAKSVLKAMDALEQWSGGRLRRFVLMGESKRAWTAWMAASAEDTRVVGIVATVFDNLAMDAQLRHQEELWGAPSPSLHDYTDRELHARSGDSAGRRLGRVVDPYSYLSRVRARLLQVHGSNDPYWAVDARSLYASYLPSGSALLTLPNEGHVIQSKGTYFQTAGAFTRACALNVPFPYMEDQLDERKILFVKLIKSAESAAVIRYCRLYFAESETMNFSDSVWEVGSQCRPVGTDPFKVALPRFSSAAMAVFVLADIDVTIGDVERRVTLSSPVRLLKRSVAVRFRR